MEAARDGRLVVFVGAGASMIPPTSLPSWTRINAEVLRGLVARSGGGTEFPDLIAKERLTAFEEHITNGLSQSELPPEYFSGLSCRC